MEKLNLNHKNDVSWHIYIVETECGSFYTGIATDVERRYLEHKAMFETKKGRGAKYFRARMPKQIVYQERSESRSFASKREYQIKQMSRKMKENLIQNQA